MRALLRLFFVILSIIVVPLQGSIVIPNNVHFLEQDEVFKYSPGPYSSRQLHIFCYQGKPKYIIHIWQSVLRSRKAGFKFRQNIPLQLTAIKIRTIISIFAGIILYSLNINHPTDDYNQFDGSSPEQVEQEYIDKKYSWTMSLFSTKSKNIKLNPFNTSCIGIDSRDSYSIHLKVIKIDLWRLLSLVFGILLFLTATNLSKNTLFHYICGISFGICASFLILIYFISKIFPRKTMMYGVIGAGWTIVIYFLQILWDNVKVITSTYRAYVIWYTVITGTISFILCYRWGPVENQRTINLIKWGLQLLGLVAIFLSSHFQEAAMGQIILLLLLTHLPKKWVSAPKSYWKRKFPPKLKPLSNDEYYEQGVRETNKALEELRQFCSSPQCNQWKTALKIKDVKRFASFIEGNSHLSDDEVLEYETSIRGELTDDEYSDLSDDDSS